MTHNACIVGYTIKCPVEASEIFCMLTGKHILIIHDDPDDRDCIEVVKDYPAPTQDRVVFEKDI
jgi:hypothetical protein